VDKIVGLLWTHLHQYTISGELTDEQMVKLSQQLDGWSAWLVEYAVSSRAQSWTPSKKTALVQRYKRSSILFIIIQTNQNRILASKEPVAPLILGATPDDILVANSAEIWASIKADLISKVGVIFFFVPFFIKIYL